jgi:hypothetical protein
MTTANITDIEGDVCDLKRLAGVMMHMIETSTQIEPEEVYFLGSVLFDMAKRIEAGFYAGLEARS